MGEFVRELAESYRCPRWLKNNHANTVWAYLFKPAPRVAYRREVLPTPDGDELHIDWLDEPDDDNRNTPLVVGCHGLEGCSTTPYMRRLMRRVRDRGWGGVALNYRGCSGEDNLTISAYHSGFTDDLALVLSHLVNTMPDRPIFLVGYSLGGSIVANFLGRHQSLVPANVRAAFLCSAPFLLAPGAGALEQGLHRVYQQKFLRTLRKKVTLKGKKFL